MRATVLTLVSLGIVGSSQVLAAPLGEHPAVIVQRLHAKQGYDYASKFYPHPAMLYLYAEPPRPMMDHPAVIVARREREAAAQTAVACPPTPTTVSAAATVSQQ